MTFFKDPNSDGQPNESDGKPDDDNCDFNKDPNRDAKANESDGKPDDDSGNSENNKQKSECKSISSK